MKVNGTKIQEKMKKLTFEVNNFDKIVTTWGNNITLVRTNLRDNLGNPYYYRFKIHKLIRKNLQKLCIHLE